MEHEPRCQQATVLLSHTLDEDPQGRTTAAARGYTVRLQGSDQQPGTQAWSEVLVPNVSGQGQIM